MTDITEITRRALENRQPTPITKQIITAIARERLALKNGETGLTYAVECAMALINKAREGDVPALRELLDRVEGKVTVPVGNDPNMPFQFERIERLIVDPRLIDYAGGTDTQN